MRNDKQWTQYWHDNVTGMWDRWIDPTKHSKALEVGSFEGASAVWLLDMIPELHITCIDIFESCFDDITGEYEYRFDDNVAEYGDRVTKIKGRSADALRTFHREEKFDLIYIDGDHSYEGAKADVSLAWPLLEKDGIIIFDDYNNIDFGVYLAVDEYFNLLDPNSYVCLREFADYQTAFRKL